MTARSIRLIEDILAEWPEHRERFRVEDGAKHMKLLLDGRLIQVLKRGANEDRRSEQNCRSRIRRALQSS